MKIDEITRHNSKKIIAFIKLFKQLWEIQGALHEIKKNKNYYIKWHPTQWGRAKELSANYQSILLDAPNQPPDSDGKKLSQVS